MIKIQQSFLFRVIVPIIICISMPCEQILWTYPCQHPTLRPNAATENVTPHLESELFLSKTVKSSPAGISKKEGFIKSETGKAPKELEDIKQNKRERLTAVDIPAFEDILEYIRKKIEVFEQRVKNPKTDWEKRQFPEYIKGAKEALERLKKLYEEKKIFSFKGLIYGKHDYALGYGSDEEIALADEIFELEYKLLAEALFHITLRAKVDYRQARGTQEYLFTENYEGKEEERRVSGLGTFLSDLIDRKARIVDGVDLLEKVQEAVKDKKGPIPVFTDQSDYPGGDWGGAYSDWDKELEGMVEQDKTFVFFGSVAAIVRVGEYYDTKRDRNYRRVSEKRHFKVLISKEEGIVGAKDIPKGLNEAIKLLMQDIAEPLQADIPAFSVIVRHWKPGGDDKSKSMVDNFVHQKEAVISVEEFIATLEDCIKEEEELYEKERPEDADKEAQRVYYEEKDELRQKMYSIRRLINQFSPEIIRSYLKAYLLRIKADDHRRAFFLYTIYDQDLYRSEVGEPLHDILWDIYLDEKNTSSENNHLLSIMLKMINSYSYGEQCRDTASKIARIFEERDLNRSVKAVEALLRLEIGKENTDQLFYVIKTAYYKKEVVAAFCFAYTILFGAKEEYLHRGMLAKDYAGPVSGMLSPNLRDVYYYLLRIEEARRRGGTLKSEADHMIAYYTIQLDNGASLPGAFGRSWFTNLRDHIHKRPSSDDLNIVRTVLHYWKDMDKSIVKDKFLVDGMEESLGTETIKEYSDIIMNMLKALKEEGLMTTLEKDAFLDEILNMRKEKLFSILEKTNPDADKMSLKRVKDMLGLWYGLSERYGTVFANIIPDIIDHEASYGMLDFMKEEYEQLLSLLDEDKPGKGEDEPVKILYALSRCRERIRHRLLFENIEIEKDEDGYYREDPDIIKEELMMLDHNMFLLGREMMVKILSQINQCNSLKDLKRQVRSICAMAGFLHSSGLGGVEFEQFVEELEKGRLKLSQLHDIIRALRMEVHKITRKINENIRSATRYVWDSHSFHDLTGYWQEEIKPKIEKDEYGHEVEVVGEEERDRATADIVDTLILDTGIVTFDQALTAFNEILHTQLTSDNDSTLYPEKEEEEIDIIGQFFRFGTPVVIPRERLLSLWSKKGLNLVKMTEEGIDVPPGVILSARLMTRPKVFKSPEFQEKVLDEIELIRKHSKYPDLKLLLYARSGSAFTLPGLLVTIPSLGMNDREAEELARETNDTWFAYDTYAEFMRSYAIHILGIPEEYFQEVLNVYEKDELTGEEMKEVCRRYKQVIALRGRGQKIPESLIEQVMVAIDAVYDSWDCKEAREYRRRHRISQEWGTVVILEKGVYGNLNPTEDGRISGTGAAALRILPDGREVIQGKFRFRSMGHQVMSGAYTNYLLLSNSERVLEGEQTLEGLQPEVYKKVLDYAHRLKTIFGNNQHFEFTVELNKVWITQSNDDIVKDDYPEFTDSDDLIPLSRGHGVSGGALRGWVANSFESAEKLVERYNRESPEGVDGVILFLDRVNPELINRIPKGVHIVAHIISVHAETLAQKYGITAVYGIPDMELNDKDNCWHIAGRKMEDGETISIDGHENQLLYHNSGKIFLGSVPVVPKVDDKVEVERRSPRALDRIRELTDQRQRQEVMAKRKELLDPFEHEVLKALEEYSVETYKQGRVSPRELMRYLMNYRAILDRLAIHCESLDFELYGEEFRKALEQRLSELGVSFEVFMKLVRNYRPRSDDYKLIIDNIIARLNYEPPREEKKREITVYLENGETATLDGRDVYGGKWPAGTYFIIHPPRQDVKLVSFEFDKVLEQILYGGIGYERIAELFKALSSMGLKVAINTVNPGVGDWLRNMKLEFPDIEVDFYYNYNGPYLERHLGGEDDLQPGEIMHFGNIYCYGYGFERSTAADLHEKGYTSVMVGSPYGYTRAEVRVNDIMERQVDAVLPKIRSIEDIVKIVKCFINVPPERFPHRPVIDAESKKRISEAVSSAA